MTRDELVTWAQAMLHDYPATESRAGIYAAVLDLARSARTAEDRAAEAERWEVAHVQARHATEAKLAEVERERDSAQRLQLDFENMYHAAEAREKAVRELLASWQRNRAAPEYGTGALGPLYVAGMATEADAIIDGLRAALAGRKA